MIILFSLFLYFRFSEYSIIYHMVSFHFITSQLIKLKIKKQFKSLSIYKLWIYYVKRSILVFSLLQVYEAWTLVGVTIWAWPGGSAHKPTKKMWAGQDIEPVGPQNPNSQKPATCAGWSASSHKKACICVYQLLTF